VVAKSRHGVMSRSMRSEASSLHASEPVVSLITWRPQAWERRLSLRVDSRSQGSAVPTQGRLSYATTDWRILCRPISFDSGSAAAVGRQERWTQRLFVWLAKGGRTVEDFESNGCARRAREAGRRRRCIAGCAERRAGETTYARGGESARTRWSCGGRARPPNLRARRSHGRAHWQKETALWARWGAHRERVEADA